MNPRLAAARALAPVLAGKASLGSSLPPLLDKVDPRDRGLAQDLAFGTAVVWLLVGSIFAFALATLIGLGATYFALTRGAAFGALRGGRTGGQHRRHQHHRSQGRQAHCGIDR